MYISFTKNDIAITDLQHFDLAQTLESGQCFRWQQLAENRYSGIVCGCYVEILQDAQGLTFFNTTEADFEQIWRPFFHLDCDYASIFVHLINLEPELLQAAEYSQGIRILAQEPWEALCSFIISQNNNIPRIKGIIGRLCECFGEPLANGKGYAFPTVEALMHLNPEDLAPLRSGFRAKYILDAAKKIGSGIVNLPDLRTLPLAQARAELVKICGVGPKVADCTLLYGLGHLEAFPVDVWIKRVMEQYFPNGTPITTDSYAGVAQQYLFYWVRSLS
ncbi:MAG: DNA-3-methyladenine glycosylase [Oscillospiraceae bacterium]|jgi:N-glycosylase/DNA lyase|nr:DNA-3-methyladenine glycosylase [Oscillospiraceae bacterium]